MNNDEINYGLIYGLTNPYFSGLVKIGATRSLDISKRMGVLGTAVPKPFTCVFAYKVPHDMLFSIEHTLHDTFAYCRMPGSEFFDVDYRKVDKLLLMLGRFDPMKEEVQDVINSEEAKRKPNMDFHALGLRAGDTLYYSKDRSITCTIVSSKKVMYDGQVVSLSSFTYKLLGYSVRVQPSPYWETKDGILLSKIPAARCSNAIAAAQNECEQLIKDCHENR